jgi:23S rRNA-/tRNA-specific pseudouridylate synthase
VFSASIPEDPKGRLDLLRSTVRLVALKVVVVDHGLVETTVGGSLLAGDRFDAQDRDMFPILYRDDHLVAIHKPAGLLVHRTTIDAHERRAAVQLLRRQLRRRVYPVHRLDKGASGVLLFALSREVAQALNALFAQRQVEKTYLAVVRGYPPECGEIDYPLTHRRDGIDRQRRTGVASSLSDVAIRGDPSGSGPAERTPAAGLSAREAVDLRDNPSPPGCADCSCQRGPRGV